MEFFAAGAIHRERMFMAANRIGKSEGAGGFELTLHLTGLYPPWWVGRRFPRAVRAWACGDTNITAREIVQQKLLGPIGELGTGLIPGDKIVGRPTHKAGLRDAVDTARVQHVTGGVSVLGIKSYEAGRKTFQGTEQDVIWLDEEPPLDVYVECLTRTMTTKGIVMLTFTPLQGMSDVVLEFLPGGRVK
jgi:phage terminase large subunit-like protein